MVGLLRNALRFVVVFGVGGIVSWLAVEGVKVGVADPTLRDWSIAVIVPLALILMTVAFCVWIWKGESPKAPPALMPGPQVIPQMQGQMALLHEEGLNKHDELRGLRDYTIESHTRAHYDEWFASWDARVSRLVIEDAGIQYWGQFGGDNGLVATDLSAFPEWVQEMATVVDRRLLRLRWIANGKVGLAP